MRGKRKGPGLENWWQEDMSLRRVKKNEQETRDDKAP